MSFLSLIGVEWTKIRRSNIFLILVTATVILWIPSILNAYMNFDMQAEGISPENNFFIQGLWLWSGSYFLQAWWSSLSYRTRPKEVITAS